MEMILSLLPGEHVGQIKQVGTDGLEEIRINAGQPMLLRKHGAEHWLYPKIPPEEVSDILKRACRQSVYAYRETLRQGFVTIDGGHRIGVCGTSVLENGTVQSLTHPSSLLFRIARPWPGFADELLPAAVTSMLLIGPPCSGKTSLLRDLVRLLSDERRQRVSLVDERGELAAVVNGIPQSNVGMRTDVMANIPKSEGIMIMLRTMNPQWIAVDEITAPLDLHALEQASYCGVKLLATAHADRIEDLYHRPLYKALMQKKIFSTVVCLKQDKTYNVVEVHT